MRLKSAISIYITICSDMASQHPQPSLSLSLSPRVVSNMLWQLFVTVTLSRKKGAIRQYKYVIDHIYIYTVRNSFGFIFPYPSNNKTSSIYTNTCTTRQGNLHLEILMTKHWRFFSGFPARKCLSSALRKWRALGGLGGWKVMPGLKGMVPSLKLA